LGRKGREEVGNEYQCNQGLNEELASAAEIQQCAEREVKRRRS
jgi:hypothetical protein